MRFKYFHCLAFLFLSPALTHGEEKPATASKPIRFWIERLDNKNPAARNHAVEMIRQDFPETELIWEFGYAFGETIETLERCGTELKPHVPTLLELLKQSNDEEVISIAAELLMVVGPDARSIAPELKPLILQNELNGQHRQMALFVLLHVLPEDQPVGSVIINLLNEMPEKTWNEIDKNSALETVGLAIPLTAGCLIRSGHTKVEVPYLAKIALGDYPAFVRAVAIATLGALEFEASVAVPELRKLLQDDEQRIRYWAADALMQIQQDKSQIPELIKALKLTEKEQKEVEEACQEFFESKEKERKALEEIDENDDVFMPTLLGMLKHGNGAHRRYAIRNLAIIGPEAKSALEDLQMALKDSDEETRQLAAEAIRRITSSKPD